MLYKTIDIWDPQTNDYKATPNPEFLRGRLYNKVCNFGGVFLGPDDFALTGRFHGWEEFCVGNWDPLYQGQSVQFFFIEKLAHQIAKEWALRRIWTIFGDIWKTNLWGILTSFSQNCVKTMCSDYKSLRTCVFENPHFGKFMHQYQFFSAIYINTYKYQCEILSYTNS